MRVAKDAQVRGVLSPVLSSDPSAFHLEGFRT
jgi:hypothetical protein